MKKLIAALVLFIISSSAMSSITQTTITAKVASVDEKTVTLEMGGESIKFSRQKLGEAAKKIVVGQELTITFANHPEAKHN